MNIKLFERKSEKFRIGDVVKIKDKTYYGYKKTWFISYIFSNGDIALRNIKSEEEIMERYNPEDLKLKQEKVKMIVGEIECQVWPKGKVFKVKQNLLACLLGVPVTFDKQVLDSLKNNQGAYISEPTIEDLRKRTGIKPLSKQGIEKK